MAATLLAGCQWADALPISSADDRDYPALPSTDQLVGPVPISHVIDGDTVRVQVDGDTQTVRLVGVDTPELVDPRKPVQCFAKEASDYTKAVLHGQSVYLEHDPSQGDYDRYGRALAYVWTQSGRMVNLDLIHDGYATEYTYQTPYRYRETFTLAQIDAANQQRGLWSPSTCAGQPASTPNNK